MRKERCIYLVLPSYFSSSGLFILQVVTASGAPVIKTDLQASNGVVHIIDQVMYPIPTGANLAEYFQREPIYSTLYAALQVSATF